MSDKPSVNPLESKLPFGLEIEGDQDTLESENVVIHNYKPGAGNLRHGIVNLVLGFALGVTIIFLS